MKPSTSLIAFVKVVEGCRLTAYQDGGGRWTIGYGHTGPEVHQGMTITQAEADALLQKDLTIAANNVMANVIVPLSQGQFDSLCDFVFNIGISNFRHSTLLKVLNQGHYNQGPGQLMRWVHDEKGVIEPGLVKRREGECKFWTLEDKTNGSATLPAG